MSRRKRFQTTIYAMVDDDPDGAIFASESVEDFADGEEVGVYELKEVRTKRVGHELIATKRRSK